MTIDPSIYSNLIEPDGSPQKPRRRAKTECQIQRRLRRTAFGVWPRANIVSE